MEWDCVKGVKLRSSWFLQNDKRIPPEELPYFHEGTVDELARRLNAC